MGRIRRGGYLFITWIGDHSPRHVHVFKDDAEVVVWNLEEWCAMQGRADRRIRRLLEELVEEGRL